MKKQSLFPMLRNKKWQEQWDYINGLTECGGYGIVGVAMIAKLHEVIRETYKAGFKDGRKSMRTHKSSTISRVLRG